MEPQRFAFEDIGSDLKILPLAARRALDVAGRKLSLAAWQAMPIDARRALVACGANDHVDVERVIDLVGEAHPTPLIITPQPDPAEGSVPAELVTALGAARRLDADRWASLEPLARYALVKVARRGASFRLAQAYDEITARAAERGADGIDGGQARRADEHAHAPHWNERGEAHMVNVGEKTATSRTAVASASVLMNEDTMERLADGAIPKGDVLGAARIAGIQAAKRTSELIPLCHVVAMTGVDLGFTLDRARNAVDVRATVRAFDRTGVEMEALVAASIAALTIYDMLKGLDRTITITDVALVEKSGGRSGHFRRDLLR